MTGLEPYKRRQVREGEDVWAYRNLMRTDGVWYSLMQRGLVVAHAREVVLSSARFVVREGGRRRVVASGVKNVHAFVVGRLFAQPAGSFSVPGASALRGRYNPRELTSFVYDAGGVWLPVWRAAGARLDGAGLTIWAPVDER